MLFRSLNLPSLKSLELSWVELPDDFAQKLFIGCPSLVRLKLWGCDLYFSGISSEVLKELTLSKCLLYEQMQISCPNVVSLFMGINLKRGGISLKNMSSLVNVDIKLFGYFSHDFPVLNLFGGLSNVTNLELHNMNFLVIKVYYFVSSLNQNYKCFSFFFSSKKCLLIELLPFFAYT